jgi:two-component system cell cycle sensor histidine kinase/response regulator CckA
LDEPRQTPDGPEILIIDDHEAVLNLALEVLRRSGHNVVGTSDPKKALELIAATPNLRVLISDIDLVTTTGPALVREALKNRPEVAVIFMTGNVDESTIRRTDPLIRKPFNISDLRAEVERALKKARPSARRREGPERRRVS